MVFGKVECVFKSDPAQSNKLLAGTLTNTTVFPGPNIDTFKQHTIDDVNCIIILYIQNSVRMDRKGAQEK